MQTTIFIISPFYPPESIISAQTSFQIASTLYANFYKVKVITSFPNRPQGEIFPGYSRKFFQKKIINTNFEIIRCFSFLSKKSSIFSRTIENLSFGLTSGMYLLFSKKPDLIYVNTWPIIASGIVRFIVSVKRIPLIISVQDVYPESLEVQGRISKKGLIAKILTSIDCWIARGSVKIVTISDVFAEIYQNSRGVSKDKIVTIPNWVDKNSIDLVSKIIFRDEKGIPPDAFVIVFGGNIGVAAGLEFFIKALGNFNTNKKIFFIIAGSGSQLDVCKQASKEKSWINFIFHSPWKQEETSNVLAAADILLLPTLSNQSMVSTPSKLISYMLAAKPILAICEEKSEITALINTANCGWVIQSEKIHEVSSHIETIMALPESTLQQKGNFGREYALMNLVSDVCLPKVIELIESSVSKK